MQLYGGFVSSSLQRLLNPDLSSLYSVFDCHVDDLPSQVAEDSTCSILDNIISRGKPTLCSPYVERALADRLALTQECNTMGSIGFELSVLPDEGTSDLLYRALVCVDPRLEYTKHQLSLCDADSEREFLRTILPNIVGPYAAQLLELQRPLSSIIMNDQHEEQRVDFACEFPVRMNTSHGLVIEIDGGQHDEEPQKSLDDKRDEAVRRARWETVRIKTREFSDIPEDKIAQLKAFFQDEYAQAVYENYREPFWKDDLRRRVFQLVLIPLAVARIQKTLVQLIHSSVLSFEAPIWKIAVFERDVPCAWLAVQDFLHLLRNLLTLQGRNFAPKVELCVYSSEEFSDAEVSIPDNVLDFEYHRQIAGFLGDREVETFDADVLIDVAVLQRSGLTTIEPRLKERVARNAVTAVVRSVHRVSETRHVASAEPFVYQLDSEEKRESLRYFLHYLFRKAEFREGQIGILERALARKDVIGLLPTGAGKSLCYQLSALLQPGITLVIDPIKSLMHDQDDHLKEAGIDSTTFIDSSLKSGERRKHIKRLQDGEFLFTFVSPERLMIQEFRDALTEMGTSVDPKWFSYCVIDEAHCVSEWGHDFRTAYLRLGENARRFCKPASGNLPFIALTGTASFDVLSDVQRELQLEDEKAIVHLNSHRRDELYFEVIRVSEPQDRPANKKGKWETYATQKKAYLANWLRKLPQQFGYQTGEESDFYACKGELTNSGLVFCPHVSNVFGVNDVSTYLKQTFPQMQGLIGEYSGGSMKGESDSAHQKKLDKTQRRFRDNDLVLLVVTKSFGMGIDKPNIRYTLHFNMPPSLEAFYQEAGRAGRDRQKAVCGLLFSEKFSDKELIWSFINDAFRGKVKEKLVIYELLSSIESSSGSFPGIERMLEDMDVNQTKKLIIHFENGRIEKIARYTHRPIEKIQEAYTSSNYHREEKRVEKFAEKLNVPVTKETKRDFEHIRMKSETFKAIYRLSVVGAIDDYTIDYKNKLIEATITKHTDEEYVKMLSRYVSRYMSPQEASHVPEQIKQRSGNTVLQKCLGYLISFVYERIKKQREEALNVMEQAAKVGAYPNGDSERDADTCQRDFSDFVYNYFDSRYTPELRERLYDYDLDLVWQYIAEVKGEPGPTKHLRGSCDRLLVENPENAALLLLRAYTRIILMYNEEDVLRDLQRGFKLFKDQVGHYSVVKAVSRFYREIERQGGQMLPAIREEMTKLHLEWLGDFNRKLERK